MTFPVAKITRYLDPIRVIFFKFFVTFPVAILEYTYIPYLGNWNIYNFLEFFVTFPVAISVMYSKTVISRCSLRSHLIKLVARTKLCSTIFIVKQDLENWKLWKIKYNKIWACSSTIIRICYVCIASQRRQKIGFIQNDSTI